MLLSGHFRDGRSRDEGGSVLEKRASLAWPEIRFRRIVRPGTLGFRLDGRRLVRAHPPVFDWRALEDWRAVRPRPLKVVRLAGSAALVANRWAAAS